MCLVCVCGGGLGQGGGGADDCGERDLYVTPHTAHTATHTTHGTPHQLRHTRDTRPRAAQSQRGLTAWLHTGPQPLRKKTPVKRGSHAELTVS